MTIDLARWETTLRRLWPKANTHIPGLLEAMIAQAPTLFARFGLDTMSVCNAFGEFGEECGCGLEVDENLNYRANVLHTQWPMHFTMEQAIAMQHQPRLIADQAYNGRMGNRLGTDDGWNYRGRGPAQTTGADAYRTLGQKMGLDLIAKPELINTSAYFLLAGLTDFVEICGCLPFAQRDDEVNETRHLNGGLIGYHQRQVAIHMWKQNMGIA